MLFQSLKVFQLQQQKTTSKSNKIKIYRPQIEISEFLFHLGFFYQVY